MSVYANYATQHIVQVLVYGWVGIGHQYRLITLIGVGSIVPVSLTCWVLKLDYIVLD
jgi:hypothetical protein